MYRPPYTQRDDPGELAAVIDAARLGTLVSVDAGRPRISHVPMLLDRADGPHGTLLCHLARANGHWRTLDGAAVTVAFLGAAVTTRGGSTTRRTTTSIDYCAASWACAWRSRRSTAKRSGGRKSPAPTCTA